VLYKCSYSYYCISPICKVDGECQILIVIFVLKFGTHPMVMSNQECIVEGVYVIYQPVVFFGSVYLPNSFLYFTIP